MNRKNKKSLNVHITAEALSTTSGDALDSPQSSTNLSLIGSVVGQPHFQNYKDFCNVAIQCLEELEEIQGENGKHGHICNETLKLHKEVIKGEKMLTYVNDQRTPSIYYLSPEQTGKMNKIPDYRADFYSLGVAFYSCLAQAYPHTGSNTMEIIYSHIVQKPDSMEYVPKHIEMVVMKMLEKAPEDRYKSCQGIIHDLNKCKELLDNGVFEETFDLGTEDYSGKLAFPQKLFGRKDLLNEMEKSIEQLSGVSTLVTVTGYSGSGKTAIVNELHGKKVDQGGFFLNGKWEQAKSKEPYTAFQTAFGEMVEQIFLEDEENIKEWKELIKETLTDRAQVLCDFMPAFTPLVEGNQKVEELKGKNALDRFNIVFTEFLKSFTSPENPLIIALDDAQFADSASLDLIKLIVCKNPVPGLAIVLSFKNELGEEHPLEQLIKATKESEANYSAFTVDHLKTEFISQFLAELLSLEEGEAHKELVQVIVEKTHGNPFFVRATITKMYEEKLLKWNKKAVKWEWDIEKVRNMAIANNVVEILTEKIQQLEPFVIKVLQICSVIGQEFDDSLIAKLIDDDLADKIDDAFSRAKSSDLIIPILNVKMSKKKKPEEAHILRFKWAHDRVQQSAYTMIDDDLRKKYHYKIGMSLKQKFENEGNLDDKIFEVVQQFNEATDVLVNEDEKIMVAKLNNTAAQAAYSTVAYQEANDFAKAALELFPNEGIWKIDEELAYDLYLMRSRCEYSLGHTSTGVQFVDELRKKVHDENKLAIIYQMVLSSYVMLGRFEDAVEAGSSALTALGIKFPKKISKVQMLHAVIKLLYLCKTKRGDYFYKKQRLTSEKAIISMKLIQEMFMLGSVLAQDEISIWALTKAIEYAVKHGVHTNIPFNFLSLLLCGMGQLELAQEYGDLGRKLAEEYDNPEQLGINCFVRYGYLGHMKRPRIELEPLKHQAANYLLRAGQTQIWGFCLGNISSFVMERSLIQPRLDLIAKCHDLMKTYSPSDNQTIACMALYHAFYDTQRGTYTDDLCDMTGEFYSEEEYEQIIKSHGDSPPLRMYINYCKMALYFIAGRYEEAYVLAKEVVVNSVLKAQIMYQDFLFYYVVICARIKKFKKASKLLKIMENRTLKCFENYSQLYFLAVGYVMKMKHKSRGKKVIKINQKIIDKYNEITSQSVDTNRFTVEQFLLMGIKLSKASMGFTDPFNCLMAHSNEFMGEFYHDSGNEYVAKMFLQQAIHYWKAFGADLVASNIETKYPYVSNDDYSGGSFKQANSTTEDVNDLNEQLDLNTIVTATQTIAREVKLDDLLQVLLQLSMKNAGSDSGTLMVVSDIDHTMRVVATGVIRTNNAENYDEDDSGIDVKLVDGAINDFPVAKTLVNLAFHSKSEVIVNDAKHDDRMKRDIKKVKKAKSIFVLPLVNQNKVLGILYLENQSMTGAFTSAHKRALEIVGSQAAISIQNANIFDNMENLINRRTNEINSLLRKVYPAKILQRIQRGGERKIADEVAECSIYFSDIVKFTNFTNRNDVSEVHFMLDSLFSKLDYISECLQIEKIKTIGDAYVAISGAPEFHAKHAIFMAEFALCSLEAVEQYNAFVEARNNEIESQNALVDADHVTAELRGYTPEEAATFSPLKDNELNFPINIYNRQHEMYNRVINEWNKTHENKKSRRLDKIMMRVGVNAGPIIAGVFTETRPIYDILGDTVNTACRMESHGQPDRVHISEAFYEMIKDHFECESRGEISVKGKGKMKTYFIVGRKSDSMLTPEQSSVLEQTGTHSIALLSPLSATPKATRYSNFGSPPGTAASTTTTTAVKLDFD